MGMRQQSRFHPRSLQSRPASRAQKRDTSPGNHDWPHHPTARLRTVRDGLASQVHVPDREVEGHSLEGAVSLLRTHVVRTYASLRVRVDDHDVSVESRRKRALALFEADKSGRSLAHPARGKPDVTQI